MKKKYGIFSGLATLITLLLYSCLSHLLDNWIVILLFAFSVELFVLVLFTLLINVDRTAKIENPSKIVIFIAQGVSIAFMLTGLLLSIEVLASVLLAVAYFILNLSISYFIWKLYRHSGTAD